MACYYYWHESKKMKCFLMFMLMVLICLMQTSMTLGRQLCDHEKYERLGTLAAMLPKGSVPPSGPSPGINAWSMRPDRWSDHQAPLSLPRWSSSCVFFRGVHALHSCSCICIVGYVTFYMLLCKKDPFLSLLIFVYQQK